jgi:hypothetical protein
MPEGQAFAIAMERQGVKAKAQSLVVIEDTSALAATTRTPADTGMCGVGLAAVRRIVSA